MTVKKLTDDQKSAIVLIYNAKTRTLKEIAAFLAVSPRTIARVLEERGVALPQQVISAEAKKVMALLYKHKLTYEQLDSLLGAVMVKPSIQELLATTDSPALQLARNKKSPRAHNGKQTLLPLAFSSFNIGTHE